MADRVDCPYCRLRHLPRHLCDPAKAVLDAMVRRGQSFDMPTMEFDQPVHGDVDAGALMLQQLVVKAGLIDVAGVHHPILVFTGRTQAGPLTPWVYAGTDAQIHAAARLVHDMAEMAIRRAGAANVGGTDG